MKYSLIILLVLLSCTSTSKIKNDKADEKIEGAVISKKTPKSVKGFTFEKKYNAYFRNDLTKSLKNRIMKKLKKGESPKDKSPAFLHR